MIDDNYQKHMYHLMLIQSGAIFTFTEPDGREVYFTRHNNKTYCVYQKTIEDWEDEEDGERASFYEKWLECSHSVNKLLFGLHSGELKVERVNTSVLHPAYKGVGVFRCPDYFY